jgi:hypothetical protein
MILHPRCSHAQHRSHVARVAQLSPSSPQLWITPVNKPVNNRGCDVRFAGYVRLSPYVDHLWTDVLLRPTQHTTRCGYLVPGCAQPDEASSSSPTVHHELRSAPTHSPQTKIKGLRVREAFVHTFHTTDDDDYIHRSMSSHINNDATAVDDSRTLITLGSSTTKYEGGHE